jgi:putative endonuclease
MARHNKLGTEGEQLAIPYLKEKGYTILAVNWRFGKKEIDIIAQYQKTIVIVEVKTRSSDYFGRPEESVNSVKQKFLIAAANKFLEEINFEAEVRYDIVSIIKSSTNTKIEHIEDAFFPLIK